MSELVVDSCIVAKWILPEPDSDKAKELIARADAGGEQLVILDLAFAEVTNAIWKRHRRRLVTLDEARQLLQLLKRVPVKVEPAARLIEPAFEVAAIYDRSVYDALFIALMQERGVGGVTSDEPLFNTMAQKTPLLTLLRNR